MSKNKNFFLFLTILFFSFSAHCNASFAYPIFGATRNYKLV